jgi:hypothetical protein
MEGKSWLMDGFQWKTMNNATTYRLMDLEVLCNLKELAIENDNENDLEEDKPREPVTFDEVNNLAIQLKTLQVQIGALGGEYHAVTLAMSEACDDLLSVYRKNKTKNIKETEGQQSSINQSIL